METTKNSKIKIRIANIDDALAIVKVRCDAIQNIAAEYYAQPALDEWAGTVDGERVQKLLSNSADIRIVVEIDDEIVGYGELVTKENLLGACYVLSSVGGKGVGKVIVAELEHIAREKEITYLQMESSVNAENFYIGCGYEVTDRGEHVMQNGMVMDCVMMRKDL